MFGGIFLKLGKSKMLLLVCLIAIVIFTLQMTFVSIITNTTLYLETLEVNQEYIFAVFSSYLLVYSALLLVLFCFLLFVAKPSQSHAKKLDIWGSSIGMGLSHVMLTFLIEGLLGVEIILHHSFMLLLFISNTICSTALILYCLVCIDEYIKKKKKDGLKLKLAWKK